MKLFRTREPKTKHPHHVALSHIKNAHKALMDENATEGLQHIGRAFQAVQSQLPKPVAKPAPPPAKAPANSDGSGDDTGIASLAVGRQRLANFNSR